MFKLGKMALTLVLAGLSFASIAETQAQVTPPVPAALQMAVRSGVKVEKSFPAAGGLTGWVLAQPDGQSTVVYSTADGKYVLAGALVDETGKNLTAAYTEAQIPRPDFAKIEKSTYFIEGAKQPKSIVYVFMDPNCIFCHLEWKALQPYEKAGLQVRWIPVAFLKPDSMGKAAALLQSKDPAALLQQLQTKFDVQHESGGIAPAAQMTPAVQASIKSNGELMRSFGFNGTPAMVYKDASGKVQYHPGMIRLSELPGMFNLPAQTITDPDLARFK